MTNKVDTHMQDSIIPNQDAHCDRQHAPRQLVSVVSDCDDNEEATISGGLDGNTIKSSKNMDVEHNSDNKMEMPSPTIQETATAAVLQSSITFPFKLFRMMTEVERNNQEHIVWWNEEGNGVVFHDKKAFENEIMRNHFNHKSSRSLDRQFVNWNFRRPGKKSSRHFQPKNCFIHDLFQRDRPDLLVGIIRRKDVKSSIRRGGVRINLQSGASGIAPVVMALTTSKYVPIQPAESPSCSNIAAAPAADGMAPLASVPVTVADFLKSLDDMTQFPSATTNAASKSQSSHSAMETAAHAGNDSKIAAGLSAAMGPASKEPNDIHESLCSTKSVTTDDVRPHQLELAVPQVEQHEEEERSSPNVIQDYPGFVELKPKGPCVAAAKAALAASGKQVTASTSLNRAVSWPTTTSAIPLLEKVSPIVTNESRRARVKTAAEPVSFLDVFGDDEDDGGDYGSTNDRYDVDLDCSFEPINLHSLPSYRQLLPRVGMMTASPTEGIAVSVGQTIARPQAQYPEDATNPPSFHLFLQRVAISSLK